MPFLNNLKDLDPSYQTDLDFWDCFGRGKSSSYKRRNTVLPILSRSEKKETQTTQPFQEINDLAGKALGSQGINLKEADVCNKYNIRVTLHFNTIKSAYMVTSIKGSPVLSSHILRVP